MRRRASFDNGFFLAYIINMLFRMEWVVFAVILFVLEKWLGIPSWCWKASLAIWVIWPAILTLILGAILSSSSAPSKVYPNKNPYSVKTNDYLPPFEGEKTNDEK